MKLYCGVILDGGVTPELGAGAGVGAGAGETLFMLVI